MENIVDIHDYNKAMQKTLLDKVWYLDKIDKSVKYLFDFGCADGSMVKFINEMFPDHFEYFLIDNNPEMLKIAERNIRDYATPIRAHYCSSIEEAISQCEDIKKSVLVLNSVIHEILSYCNYDEQRKLFEAFFQNGFGYIAIRDMHLFSQPEFTFNSNKKLHNTMYDDFVKHFPKGVMDKNQMQIEFLLKTDYYNNWERERDERYLWNWSQLIYIYSCGIYKTEWEEDFSLSYHRRKWYREFGVSQTKKIKTHKKLLLRGC